jgi:hypothetical protein
MLKHGQGYILENKKGGFYPRNGYQLVDRITGKLIKINNLSVMFDICDVIEYIDNMEGWETHPNNLIIVETTVFVYFDEKNIF